MKHWGLQFEARVKNFSAELINARLRLTGKLENKADAERVLSGAQQELSDAQIEFSAKKSAVEKLIEIGTEGLCRWEGEGYGTNLSIEQFLNEMDNHR